jgi:anti-sigma factor RsiW
VAAVTGPEPHPCELLGGYVLGLLGPVESAVVEHHLLSCDACCEETADLVRVAALLAPRRRHRPWRRVAAVAAAGVAAAAVVAAVLAAFLPAPALPVTRVALRSTLPGSAASGTAVLSRRPWGTQIVLAAHHLPPSDAGYTAEVVGTSGSVVPLGSWGPTPDRSALVELATSLSPGRIARVVIVADGLTILEGRPPPPVHA